MKRILLIILLIINGLNADIIYECNKTEITKDGETYTSSKKPTIIVDTNWMKKPTVVKVYLRDRDKSIYDKVQFQGINKQDIQEWLKGPTIFNGSDNTSLTIYDKGNYYLIKTKISDSLYAENECIKN